MQFNYYKLWFLLWRAFLIPVQLLMIQCVSCSSYSRQELCCLEINLKRMPLACLISCLAGRCKIKSTTDLPETFSFFLLVLFLLDYEIAWSLSPFYCKRLMDTLATVAWEWPLHPERGNQQQDEHGGPLINQFAILRYWKRSHVMRDFFKAWFA